jgi:hypothetical protein
MNEVQYEAVLYEGPEAVKVTEVRLSQPPDTESCAVRGESSPERGCRDRTTIVKRRQGTLQTARRSRILLKLFSLVRKPYASEEPASGEVVAKTKPNMSKSVNGKDEDGLPGSKRVVCKERDDRNLGGPSASSHWLDESWPRGRFDQRKKTNRWVTSARRRGDSDHSILGQGKMYFMYIPNRLKGVTGQRSLHTETYPGEKGPDTREGLIYI